MSKTVNMIDPYGRPVPITLDELTDKFKHWIFDADGTLRRCTIDRQPCPNKPNEWETIIDSARFLNLINWGKSVYSIVSNQGGVELGYLTEKQAMDLLIALGTRLQRIIPGLPECAYFMCPWDDPSHPDRKPNPGMLVKAIVNYGFPRDRDVATSKLDSIMIGDMDSDKQAAQNAGIHFVNIADIWELCK